MKIAYIASHIYRHTFEINEVAELLQQRPDTRVYSFYRGGGENIQRERIKDVPGDIISWSYKGMFSGAAYLIARYPGGFLRAAFLLTARSLRNPVYWAKNFAAFWMGLPILADASRHSVRHFHANFGSSPATIAWVGKKMMGVGMSVTYHAFDIYSGPMTVRDPLKKTKLRDADLVVAVHEDGQTHLRELVPDVSPEKFRVIRISVEFEPKKKSHPLPTPPLVVAAGNLMPKKGFGALIKAVGLLKRKSFPVRLRVLGEGPERLRLESMVREEGIRDRTEIPGYFQHRELAAHLADASVFVAPSRVTVQGLRDGIPTVVIEAWLSGTPVVASLVGGMGEVIVHGETALVFRQGDYEGLADCLEELLTSDELCQRIVENGRRLAQKDFSAQKNVCRLI
ncbi:MAG: glycosyltransferase family 4 protein, partial [bacterium]|nr:glycosyltransferase family 4 protein [bacterium]